MNAMIWSPERLMARHEKALAATDDLIVAVRRGARATIVLEESRPEQDSENADRIELVGAQLREGCIKAVEAAIRPFPQRGRVLAELHRRLDHVSEMDRSSVAWRSRLAAILSFAGAWTLAARLMRAGIRVCVIEGDSLGERSVMQDSRADVNIVIPIGPAATSRSSSP